MVIFFFVTSVTCDVLNSQLTFLTWKSFLFFQQAFILLLTEWRLSTITFGFLLDADKAFAFETLRFVTDVLLHIIVISICQCCLYISWVLFDDCDQDLLVTYKKSITRGQFERTNHNADFHIHRFEYSTSYIHFALIWAALIDRFL